jgi:opacity protein-like surface antigen
MKKLYIMALLLCVTLLSGGANASGYYSWEENYSYRPNIPQNYIAIRAGYSMLSGAFNNTMGNDYTTYVRECATALVDGECTDDKWLGYGPEGQFSSVAPAYLAADSISFWKDYDVDSELDAGTGRMAIAFGGYLSGNRNIRIEGEFNKYMTFDHNDDRAYVGYQKKEVNDEWVDVRYDDKMAVSYTSKVDSSSFMINTYYDFNSGHPKIGDFVPFMGLGVGIAVNKVQFSLKDQASEFEDFLKTYYSETESLYPTMTTETESLSWAIMMGGTYVLSRNTALELGLRYSNLGAAEWAFDEYQSFFESEGMISTEMFMGLKFNF